jgi:hypothetical protein
MGDLAGLLSGIGFLVVLAAYIAHTARILAQHDEPDKDEAHRA